jgi:hypothetical protein
MLADLRASGLARFTPTPRNAGGEGNEGANTDTLSPRRSTVLDWDEMRHDVALIERRARAMRAEAAWSIARAVREWMVADLGRARPPAQSSDAMRNERTGHAA